MDATSQIREFLTSRRARIGPDAAGLPSQARRRRVEGLRRDEVAMLAGISVEYYTRLERGNAAGVSREVLDAVSDALQLDEAERVHLADLVRNARPTRAPRRSTTQRVRPGVQRVLDVIDAPAIVRNGRLDVLAANRLGRAIYAPMFDSTETPTNFARYAFLDPSAPEFFGSWDSACADCVGLLRAEVGRDLHGRELTDLIGQLSTRSEEFRVQWARHDVRLHRRGPKILHHPLVGEVSLHQESFTLPGDSSLMLAVYNPEPGSGSDDAIHMLASWIAADANADAEQTPAT
jgi:transcriptional regulator with XRE-family HTH domain